VTLPFNPKSITPSLRSDSIPLQIRPTIVRISSILINNSLFVNISATKTVIVLRTQRTSRNSSQLLCQPYKSMTWLLILTRISQRGT